MNKIVLEIAHKSINQEFDKSICIKRDDLVKKHPFLRKLRSCFITLKQDNRLRGCIGSIIPQKALIDEIVDNAKSAAFYDPRFSPVTKTDLKNIEIEVSVLSSPEKVKYKNIEDLKSKIVPFFDGVVLRCGKRSATFLPQVWEDLPDFSSFFVHLCLKASLSADCLEKKPEIYKYQVEKISE